MYIIIELAHRNTHTHAQVCTLYIYSESNWIFIIQVTSNSSSSRAAVTPVTFACRCEFPIAIINQYAFNYAYVIQWLSYRIFRGTHTSRYSHRYSVYCMFLFMILYSDDARTVQNFYFCSSSAEDNIQTSHTRTQYSCPCRSSSSSAVYMGANESRPYVYAAHTRTPHTYLAYYY